MGVSRQLLQMWHFIVVLQYNFNKGILLYTNNKQSISLVCLFCSKDFVEAPG